MNMKNMMVGAFDKGKKAMITLKDSVIATE